MDETVQVCAAVLRRGEKILLCSRPGGKEHAGYWEFPGGKNHPGENDNVCLKRELLEELDADIKVFDQIYRTFHEYPGKRVLIKFYRCLLKSTELNPLEGQNINWVKTSKVLEHKLLPADIPLGVFLSYTKNTDKSDNVQ